MKLVLELYPVAISGFPTDPSKSKDEKKRNSSPKRCVTGIIPDTDKLINGLYHSESVMPAQVCEFWCSNDFATSFKYGTAITVAGDVCSRNDRLSISIKEIKYNGSWYKVDSKLLDVSDDDLEDVI